MKNNLKHNLKVFPTKKTKTKTKLELYKIT